MTTDTEQWRRLADSSARWWQAEDEGAVALRAAADEVDRLRAENEAQKARIATLEALVREAQPFVPDSIMRHWQKRAEKALDPWSET